jgi:transposase
MPKKPLRRAGGNQIELESPFRTFEAVAKIFGKSAKTVGRWVRTIPGFLPDGRIDR